MIEERFWLLAGLKLTGDASPAELAELAALLEENPALQVRLDSLQALWNARAQSPADKLESAFNKHLQRLSHQSVIAPLQYESDEQEPIETPAKKPSLVKRLSWISGIAACLVIGLFVFKFNSGSTSKVREAQNTVSTKRGSKSKIQLPDGTQVWLNSDSKITYNENFQGKLREVQLSGEAFFDVVRDEARPFIIHTQVIDVKVLGTSFNVRSYLNEKNTETSLIRGSVEITLRNSPDKKFTLKPNDKLVVPNEELAAIKSKSKDMIPGKEMVLSWEKINYRKADTLAVEALWIKNKLAFDRESLEEIALKIERWYDVKVTFTNENLKEAQYSGIFEDESLQQVMSALHDAGVNYKINKKEVIIRP
jgi:transmembrane sensor